MWDDLVQQRPGTEYTTDFTKAYYYNSYQSDIAPFLNVSSVSDQRLSQLVVVAHERFMQSKTLRLYQKAFGQKLGAGLWRITRWGAVRWVGRTLANLGLFRRFRNLKSTGDAAIWG